MFVNTDEKVDVHEFERWLSEHHVNILNIVGNRASDNPTIKSKAYLTLIKLFKV